MKKKFIPVNDLLPRTSLEQFVTRYGFATSITRKGNEERIRNPFACDHCEGNQQAVSVNWQAGVFTTHCYHCNVRGRVTSLLFGMKHGRQATGGRLKGTEFKDIAADIAAVAGFEVSRTEPAETKCQTGNVQAESEPQTRKINVPLVQNPDERIARLEHLSDEFIVELESMNARARAYLGLRQFMNGDAMKNWGVGLLPSSSRSMLRGKFVYTLRDERSRKIGYAGRDLAFDEKRRKWENGDRKTAPPIKTKFPPGFIRGQFLYGAEIRRLSDKKTRRQLAKTGIVVVEGMNDVIALDGHGIVAVALCSNQLANEQLEKLVRWSRELGGGKISLMLDNDEQGIAGTERCIQMLSPHVFVRTVWTPDSSGGAYRDRQPEQLSAAELSELFANELDWR